MTHPRDLLPSRSAELVPWGRTGPATGAESNGRQMVATNGVHLCVETFGEPADQAMLLLAGNRCSMDWWEDDLCRRLMRGSRFVVRYDYRDTGRSTSYAPGSPPYGFDDLVADAGSLIETLGLEQAHIVGFSLGGGIAQRVALDRAHQVKSLTLISTTPGLRPGGAQDSDLPQPSAERRAYLAEATSPDWTDDAAVIDYVLGVQRLLAGPRGFDEVGAREFAARSIDRTINVPASETNHRLLAPGATYRSRLAEIRAPTLVVHGTADTRFPYKHGEALAAEIPGAQLIALPGIGHQIPPEQTWGLVIPALLRHSSRGRAS